MLCIIWLFLFFLLYRSTAALLAASFKSLFFLSCLHFFILHKVYVIEFIWYVLHVVFTCFFLIAVPLDFVGCFFMLHAGQSVVLLAILYLPTYLPRSVLYLPSHFFTAFNGFKKWYGRDYGKAHLDSAFGMFFFFARIMFQCLPFCYDVMC